VSKPNETTQNVANASATLYRVSYTFVTESGSLRNGAVVVEETTPEKASEIAIARIQKLGNRHVRISSVKPY